MATIVKHKESSESYVVVGSGYGAWQGNGSDETGAFSLIAVSDADGAIGWFNSRDLVVISIDGKTPHQLLNPPGPFR